MVLLLLLFIEWRERQSFYPHLSFTHSYPLGAFQGHQGVTLFWQVTVNLSSPLLPYENVALILSYEFFSCLLSIIFWTLLNIIFFSFHFWYSFFCVQDYCQNTMPPHMTPVATNRPAIRGAQPPWAPGRVPTPTTCSALDYVNTPWKKQASESPQHQAIRTAGATEWGNNLTTQSFAGSPAAWWRQLYDI